MWYYKEWMIPTNYEIRISMNDSIVIADGVVTRY